MSLREYLLLDVTDSAPAIYYFRGEEQKNQLFSAEYRVASSAPVLIRPIFRGGAEASGDLPLNREASKRVSAGHIGFSCRLAFPESGPSMIEVEVSDA